MLTEPETEPQRNLSARDTQIAPETAAMLEESNWTEDAVAQIPMIMATDMIEGILSGNSKKAYAIIQQAMSLPQANADDNKSGYVIARAEEEVRPPVGVAKEAAKRRRSTKKKKSIAPNGDMLYSLVKLDGNFSDESFDDYDENESVDDSDQDDD